MPGYEFLLSHQQVLCFKMSEPTSGDSNSRSPLPSYVGRRITPSSISNAEENEVNDFEYFGLRPRGLPNLEAFLEIWSVDVHPNPDDINRRQHHTALYDCSNLVVRRGQPFQITITVNRAIDLEKDKLWIEFLIGRYPDRTKGTYIPILIKEQLEKGQWGAKVVSIWNNALTLSVMSSPQCIVGRFRMYVAVMTPYGIRRTVRDKDTDIYILFNPWCEEDAVYLDNDAEKEEYVLNDIGCIYYGKFTEVVSRTWFFDQFERMVLDTCIYILDRAQMPLQTRGCPVKISRVVSAMQYAETGLPVCYGQCWVFAAVLNTVLRCLGIPGRVITNFSSAHDNDANLTTDIILDENGKKDTNLTKDSIWNYHCWNECWMARIDLPPEYGGWQVIDATPQETSEGMFRCGPASVNAIKHGHVYLPYDAPFIYAEVNSDIVYWNKQKDGSLIKGDVKTDEVGKLVLTKEIGSDSRKDITNQYKHEEGSPEERMALNTAIQHGLKKEQAVTEVTMDVSLNMHVPENVLLDTNFFVGIELQNNSNEKRSTTLFLSGTVVFYTGVPKIEFKRETIKVTVEPHQVIEFTNPLRKPLEHLVLRIDGLDTEKAKLKMFSILQDNATLTTKEVFVPKKRGQRKVIASLDSNALKQVIGELELNVT
ncbi:hypothetical protein chiPu_0009343 [Chiloscyllium punctatum]|uniref:Transglutaminase-like domain-containing protein n=1 Tax=Chiloscyllium punctatum TaxID=137246 RepID=A0A401SKH8_CHIPU|nr:hypothetical protein [Chiloscyllium punctatum]